MLNKLLETAIGLIAMILLVFAVYLGTLPPDAETLGCMTDTECENEATL